MMSHEIETINKETEIISISNRNSEVENYNNENGKKKSLEGFHRDLSSQKKESLNLKIGQLRLASLRNRKKE